jgi:hypothetical protein
MEVQNEQRSSEEVSLQIFDRTSFPLKQDEITPQSTTLTRPLQAAIEQTQEQFDETNDSSTSTTTSRSIHLPVEKQRGLSEIIRKRNSRYKVEDYKRSFQKSNTPDEQQLPISPLDDLTSKHSNNTYSIDIPIDMQYNSDKRAQMSIERLNVLLSNDDNLDQQETTNEYVIIEGYMNFGPKSFRPGPEK